jgi:hypothetical protein
MGLFQQFSAKMPDKYYGDGVNCVGGMSMPFEVRQVFYCIFWSCGVIYGGKMPTEKLCR